jgi:aspartate aminotransferase-like enzyme
LLDASAAALPGARPGLLALAPGPLADTALRINHTGDGAATAPVLEALGALSLGLRELELAPDAGAALEAALAAFG